MWTAARLFWRFIDALMALLLAAMIALVFTNVVLRYGFSSGIRQSVELARMWFVWVVMLGAAVALRRAVWSFGQFQRIFGVPLCEGPQERSRHRRKVRQSGVADDAQPL